MNDGGHISRTLLGDNKRMLKYCVLNKQVGRRNVLPLPHWEKRKSLLIRRLAAREVRSGICTKGPGYRRGSVSMASSSDAIPPALHGPSSSSSRSAQPKKQLLPCGRCAPSTYRYRRSHFAFGINQVRARIAP